MKSKSLKRGLNELKSEVIPETEVITESRLEEQDLNETINASLVASSDTKTTGEQSVPDSTLKVKRQKTIFSFFKNGSDNSVIPSTQNRSHSQSSATTPESNRKQIGELLPLSSPLGFEVDVFERLVGTPSTPFVAATLVDLSSDSTFSSGDCKHDPMEEMMMNMNSSHFEVDELPLIDMSSP